MSEDKLLNTSIVPTLTNDHPSAMPEGPTTGFIGLEQAANEVILVQNFNEQGTRLVTGSADECIQSSWTTTTSRT
jgi:hypothetical protein